MIMAWVLYVDARGKSKFEELSGVDYTSTDSADWGLDAGSTVHLVLQQGSFIQAWTDGVEVRKW
jgi:hypothetical protein